MYVKTTSKNLIPNSSLTELLFYESWIYHDIRYEDLKWTLNCHLMFCWYLISHLNTIEFFSLEGNFMQWEEYNKRIIFEIHFWMSFAQIFEASKYWNLLLLDFLWLFSTMATLHLCFWLKHEFFNSKLFMDTKFLRFIFLSENSR